jgi:hypothetical protein
MKLSCYESLGVVDPLAVLHPDGVLFALAAYHQEHRAVLLVKELVVDPVALEII